MTNIAESFTELIGETPLLRLVKYEKKHHLEAQIIAKLECFNPLGSVKDRVAVAMIKQAQMSGKLNKDSEIVEPTSGNTGIGLAFVGASMGYSITIVMPDSMSIERRKILKALGANLILTPGNEGMSGAIRRAEEILQNNPKAVMLQQFENPANPEIHKITTGPEIYRDTDGNVDVFVSAVGTGGTISGVGAYLKEQNPNIKVVAVQPSNSPVLSGGKAAPHKIQGIGAGFIPATYDSSVVDEVISVDDDSAFSSMKILALCEGVLVGISSGAALSAATILAKKSENKNKRIVVLFPDTGERYLSSFKISDSV